MSLKLLAMFLKPLVYTKKRFIGAPINASVGALELLEERYLKLLEIQVERYLEPLENWKEYNKTTGDFFGSLAAHLLMINRIMQIILNQQN